ncbi:MAG: NAD(P)/FAD-dependent oxidoreductase [Acidimicrobiales bacterium]
MVDGSGLRIAVIGGGIAGASAAYSLVRHPSRPRVMLLEAESQLGHHTTGRSAAQYIENYGAMPIRSLTKASLDFFENPPAEFCDQPLLSEQAILTVGAPGQDRSIDRLLETGRAINPDIAEISLEEAGRLVPLLRTDRLTRAVIEPGSSDIDVAALLQCFVRGFRAGGGEIATTARVDAATRSSGSGSEWALDTTAGPRQADVVVNAAGAWGDVVAATAGIAPVGLAPMRRTAFMVASRWDESPTWPMITDADLNWYVKPDGPQFLCSPADETPSEPMDAKPEEVDIARAIDRINTATTLDIRSVRSSWAGLRTFVPDRAMVLGPDPADPTFVWCVGQGGNGIQTAPAAGRLVAELCLDGRPGSFFDGFDLDLAGLSPDRLRT